MEIFWLTIGLTVSVYIVSKAISENNKRNLKYNPEFQKQMKKVRDFLWLQDNLYDYGDTINELEQALFNVKNIEERKKIKKNIKFWKNQMIKIKKDYYSKYPQPNSLNFPPFEEWPSDLQAYSRIVDDKGRKFEPNMAGF